MGGEAAWSGGSGVLAVSGTPMAYWVAGEQPELSPVAGYVLDAGTRVQLVAEVVQGQGRAPRSVPPLEVAAWTADGHETSDRLSPSFRICNCAAH